MLARSTRLAAGACKLHVPLCSDDAMLCAFGPPSQRGAPPGPPARGLCTTSTLQATGPEATVYSGPATADRKRVTLRHIRKKYLAGDKLSMVTAYDYPSAKHVDKAGIDMLLVGDSAAMVVHGHDNTLPITLDEMLTHCKAAARGAQAPFLVGDLPFGTYETGAQPAVSAAVRMLKEGGMDAVKLEGGSTARVDAARAIVSSGIACMGHVGLTPQSVSAIGGFRPQAQRSESALHTVQAAQALESAGCFALILECVPAPVAAALTAAVRIPTIGIGAGPHCSGQVLVFHDLLGMMSHPHHDQVTPKFCKQYAHVGVHINHGLEAFRHEVEAGAYPDAATSPYKMGAEELEMFCELLESAGLEDSAEAALKPVQSAAEAVPAASAQ